MIYVDSFDGTKMNEMYYEVKVSASNSGEIFFTNTKHIKGQLKAQGFKFDWHRKSWYRIAQTEQEVFDIIAEVEGITSRKVYTNDQDFFEYYTACLA